MRMPTGNLRLGNRTLAGALRRLLGALKPPRTNPSAENNTESKHDAERIAPEATRAKPPPHAGASLIQVFVIVFGIEAAARAHRR